MAHLTVSFLAVNPLEFFIFEVLASSRNSALAARFSAGARREGGASYCLISGRQHPLRKISAAALAGRSDGYFLATSKPDFAAIA
ncbi:MAG TPA: hypothetical protein VGE08_07700 [Steroidobacter sp.]|uniref:hypothetical protein n=1 Tax=Steroidobacter sp. TaxID=1978227 RepID=UPI002ED94750